VLLQFGNARRLPSFQRTSSKSALVLKKRAPRRCERRRLVRLRTIPEKGGRHGALRHRAGEAPMAYHEARPPLDARDVPKGTFRPNLLTGSSSIAF
jgi:hypothetical protein